MLSLPPTVVVMSPSGWNIGTVCGGRVHGKSSAWVRFCGVICGYIAGLRCPKRLHFVLPVATAVLFAAAGLTIAGLSGLLAAAIPLFGFMFFSHWRCHGFWCYFWFVVVCAISDLSDSLLPGGMILPTGNWQKMLPFGKLLFLASFML